MTNQDILHLKNQILIHLSKGQIKNAIELLAKLCAQLQDWKKSEKLNELETNYKYMLHFQFEAAEDPTRKEVYENLMRTLYELTDDMSDELFMTASSGYFYERARINSLNAKTTLPEYQKQLENILESLSVAELIDDTDSSVNQKRDLSIKRERIMSDVFMSVFFANRATEEDIHNYSSFLNSDIIFEREKCLFVSALTLNLLHRFDSRKVKLLMTISTDEKIALNQRAIVGLILILQTYDTRWQYYSGCRQQLEALSENLQFRQSVEKIIEQLIQTRETEKISKVLTEEIIPDMLKFNSLAGKKLDMQDFMGDSDLSEKNPEWKKELEESGLANKLQKYSNLQMEGADVFHSTFSNLKTFPFFNELCNWFMPFDTTYSEFQKLFSSAEKDSMLNAAIANSGHMCNSDKYSFCFSLMQIPENQRNMMLQQFGAESEEIKQLQMETIGSKANKKAETISNQYIQDLYRFFKLFPYRRSFYDVFRLPINFYDKKSIVPLISDTETMKQIALYCFDKNFLKEALFIYEKLIATEENDANLWQKIGYCRQMLNNMSGALEAYLQADLISPENTWTMKRIAQIYRSMKQPGEALSYYKKLRTLLPDNLSGELNIGHCYLDMQKYDQALNSYFKVELMDGGDKPKTWRAIAWTALLMKRFDTARQYYIKILATKPSEHDYLNAGHVELLDGKKKNALNFYMRVVEILKENTNEFFRLFDEDISTLVLLGCDENFIPLLYDEIRYKFD